MHKENDRLTEQKCRLYIFSDLTDMVDDGEVIKLAGEHPYIVE